MQFLLFVSLKGFEVLKTPFKDITSVDAPGPSSVFFLPLIRLLALHLTGDVANACLWICTPLHYSFQWWSFSKCVWVGRANTVIWKSVAHSYLESLRYVSEQLWRHILGNSVLYLIWHFLVKNYTDLNGSGFSLGSQ
jgi:hypothetical protein